MRATYIYGAGDIRVINVPDPAIQQPTDAIVRVVRACICGSDLHPYHSMPVTPGGQSIGHECVGIVEDTGADVTSVNNGDLVIVPFAWSDGTCDFCREGLQTSCRLGGFWNADGVGGCQAEAVRVLLADGTLVAAPVEEDSPLIPSLLTLSDVYGTGYHAAIKASVSPRTSVTVIGDGAVGLMAVLSARQLGAEQIILMGGHTARTDLGREFGATHVIAERGDEGIQKVRDLTGGDGTHVVIEAVGHMPAYEKAIGVVRPGGVISRVGVPQYDNAPVGFTSLFGPNITLTGGPAPARAYIQTLMPGILAGQVNPGRSSTANSPSTRSRRDTRKWTADRPSRFSFVPNKRSGGACHTKYPCHTRYHRCGAGIAGHVTGPDAPAVTVRLTKPGQQEMRES